MERTEKEMQGNITKEKKPYMRKGWKVLLGLGVCLTGLLWPGTAEAASSIKSINRDITVLRPESGQWDKTAGRILYFGEAQAGAANTDRNGPFEAGFRVLESSSSTQEVQGVAPGRSLLLESNGSGFSNTYGNNNYWSSSNFRNSLNNNNSYYNNPSLFSALENNLIAQTTLKTTGTGENITNTGYYFHDPEETQDYVFLLSLKETLNLYPSNAAGNTARNRNKPNLFLRTGASNGGNVIAGLSNGGIGIKFTNTTAFVVAPAFNLDTTNPLIMFTSAQSFNKKADLTKVEDTDDRYWTLTLKDSDIDVSVDSRGWVARYEDATNGTTIVVPYSYTADPTKGVNQISVMLTDKNFSDPTAQILYYGALQDIRKPDGSATTVAASSQGTGRFSLPNEYKNKTLGTDYHLYILAESNNSNNANTSVATILKTSYVSEPVELERAIVNSATKIDSVDIAIDNPDPNPATFPNAEIVGVNGNQNSSLKNKININTTWVDSNDTPVSSGPDFNTDYKAMIVLEVNDQQYLLGGGAEIKINGVPASGSADKLINGTNGDYYKTTIQHDVRTRLKKLVSIDSLTPISNIANGTPASAQSFGLYAAATLNLEDSSQTTAPIIWDLSSLTYDPNIRTEQTFEVKGRVDLNGLDIDDDNKSLEVKVQVTVIAGIEINDVEITIDPPVAGTALALTGSVSTPNIATIAPSITWTDANGPVAMADYNSEYTAEFTLVSNIGYAFSQGVNVTIGGAPVSGGVINNTGESISVKHTFSPTDKAALEGITVPAPITGVQSGTTVDNLNSLLGTTYPEVDITYGGGQTTKATVAWASVADSGYDSTIVTGWNGSIQGTVMLPSWIEDKNGIGLTTTVDVTVNPADVLGTPQATPGTGTYSTNQTVYLVPPTTDATIYYTTDGTDPGTSGSAVEYVGPIDVTGTEGQSVTTVIKAIAKKSGMQDSAVVEFIYTINIPQVVLPTAGAPVARPGTGTYTANQQVSLIPPTQDAKIYYTTDGSDPSTGSMEYTGPITVAGVEGQSVTVTIKAITVKSGMNNSPVETFTYTINLPQSGGGTGGNPGGGTGGNTGGNPGGGTGGNPGGGTGGNPGGGTGGNTGGNTGGGTTNNTAGGTTTTTTTTTTTANTNAPRGNVATAESYVVRYQIIEGADSNWVLNAQNVGIEGNIDNNLSFRGTGEFSKFVEVRVGDSQLEGIHYELAEGSTIVTLKESYLNTLPAGTYTLQVVWTDGSAKTNFTIGEGKQKDAVPKTGKQYAIFWLIGLTMASGAGTLLTQKKRKVVR